MPKINKTKRRVTQADVADYVGINQRTVSQLYIGPEKVSKNLQRAIKDAVRELNFTYRSRPLDR